MKRKLATLQILLVACTPLSSLQGCAAYTFGANYTDESGRTFGGTVGYYPLPKTYKK